jgi:hypothetical protein
MTNNDILILSQSLKSLGELSGIKFSYCIAKNSTILDIEVKSLQSVMIPSKEFTEFEEKRVELAKKYSKKDENGNPVFEGNQFVLEDKKNFEKYFEVLQKENKKVIEARNKQVKDFEKLLEDESNVKLFQIGLDEVPFNISVKQMTSIILLIKDEPKKNGK